MKILTGAVEPNMYKKNFVANWVKVRIYIETLKKSIVLPRLMYTSDWSRMSAQEKNLRHLQYNC